MTAKVGQGAGRGLVAAVEFVGKEGVGDGLLAYGWYI